MGLVHPWVGQILLNCTNSSKCEGTRNVACAMSASECKTRAPHDMIMMSLFCYLKEHWGDTHTTTLVTTHPPSAALAWAWTSTLAAGWLHVTTAAAAAVRQQRRRLRRPQRR